LVEEILLRLLRLFRGSRVFKCGRPRLGVTASTIRRPRAFGGRRAAGISRRRAAACWLGRHPTAGATGGRITRSRPVHPGGAAVWIRVRLGVFDRPRSPAPGRINRPVAGTTGEARHPRPAASIAAAAHADGRCHVGRRAPLLRFSGPCSVRWPRRVLVRRAAGPADSSRFGVTPRHPRRFGGGPCRATRPCGFTLMSSGRDVEVLAVADERGRTSGRIGTIATRLCTSRPC